MKLQNIMMVLAFFMLHTAVYSGSYLYKIKHPGDKPLMLPPMHQAAADNNIVQMQNLLAENYFAINQLDCWNQTPLAFAAENNAVKAVEFLLQQGANINHQDKFNNTPLHVAAFHGSFDAAEVLIQHHASCELKDSDGRTPLQVAVQFHKQELNDFIKQQTGTLLFESNKDLFENVIAAYHRKKSRLLPHKTNIDVISIGIKTIVWSLVGLLYTFY